MSARHARNQRRRLEQREIAQLKGGVRIQKIATSTNCKSFSTSFGRPKSNAPDTNPTAIIAIMRRAERQDVSGLEILSRDGPRRRGRHPSLWLLVCCGRSLRRHAAAPVDVGRRPEATACQMMKPLGNRLVAVMSRLLRSELGRPPFTEVGPLDRKDPRIRLDERLYLEAL
jgi:hypothetical protein